MAVLAIAVVVLVVAWSVMLNFVVRPYRMPSESMEPTLHAGDRFMVNELAYRSSSPRPGDVIVFKGPPSWNVGYKSIRSHDTVMRWLQNGCCTRRRPNSAGRSAAGLANTGRVSVGAIVRYVGQVLGRAHSSASRGQISYNISACSNSEPQQLSIAVPSGTVIYP